MWFQTAFPASSPPPNSSCETILFPGPDPNRSSMHESAKGAMSMMLEEQPAFSPPSNSGLSAKNSAPIRLYVSYPFSTLTQALTKQDRTNLVFSQWTHTYGRHQKEGP